jgi:serine/threonine protein phosphatase PrpC
MNVHSVSLKGRRNQNEDKHSIILNYNGKNKDIKDINFFAVYDGHGGKHISKCLSQKLPNFFINKKNIYPLTHKYINDVYTHFQNSLRKSYTQIATDCGSTCLVVIQFKYINNSYIHVLNTGDSRSILCRNNVPMVLSKDHKPNWPEEKERIEKLGGQIYRDGPDYRIKDLSVSRAFGDLSAEPYVTNMPDIFTYKLQKNDKFLVLACDGVWDVLENQDVINFIIINSYDVSGNRINKNINIARKLGEYAILRGSGDNITCIIVFF